MTTDYAFWCGDEDEFSAAMMPASIPQFGPIISDDGRMILLGAEKTKAAFGPGKSQLMKFLVSPHHAKLAHYAKVAAHVNLVPQAKLEGYTICGKAPTKEVRAYVDIWSADADEAQMQILETVSRKGITAVAPTTSVGLPPAATAHEHCVPRAEVQPLLDKIRSLEIQLRSNLPYAQMYRFGAGSLLVAIVSLIVWAFTGAGVPFHPVFAALVIPAAIGLMAMAFLVRREIPDPPKMSNK